MIEIHVPKIRQLNVRVEGRDVVVLEAGQAVLILPWDAALTLANAIRVQARRIEERVKAGRIVNDQALLMRVGIPLGLSSNPEIMNEAAKEAAWSTELRRAIPSIKSAEKFGVPTLRQGEPKK